jgi:hypothetical protein
VKCSRGRVRGKGGYTVDRLVFGGFYETEKDSGEDLDHAVADAERSPTNECVLVVLQIPDSS